MGVFDKQKVELYQHKWAATIIVHEIHAGIPANPKMIEGWIKANLGQDNSTKVADLFAETLEAVRGALTMDDPTPNEVEQTIAKMAETITRNVFKRNESGGLYIEGRQVKAMLKEAANIAVAAGHLPKGKWGTTNKGLLGFFAEHIFVAEEQIPLGTNEPDGIDERFVHTWRGSAIAAEEYVRDAKVSFTVVSDTTWPKNFWPVVMSIAERNGLGASRALGYGTFETVEWTKL